MRMGVFAFTMCTCMGRSARMPREATWCCSHDRNEKVLHRGILMVHCRQGRRGKCSQVHFHDLLEVYSAAHVLKHIFDMSHRYVICVETRVRKNGERGVLQHTAALTSMSSVKDSQWPKTDIVAPLTDLHEAYLAARISRDQGLRV